MAFPVNVVSIPLHYFKEVTAHSRQSLTRRRISNSRTSTSSSVVSSSLDSRDRDDVLDVWSVAVKESGSENRNA